MLSPQAYGSSGSAAASASPALIPIEVSSALETTTGMPMRSAICKQARTPERLHLQNGDVGCFALRHLIGILRTPDGLVGGDGHAQPGSRQPAP